MIFVDLDGVLADFVGGACQVHGRPDYDVKSWNWFEDWGMTARDFWAPIKGLGWGFYMEYVPPYPWTNDLMSVVKRTGEPWAILTASPQEPGMLAGKQEWISKYLGRVPLIMVGSDGGDLRAHDLKAMLAAPDRVLIDDSDENVDAFREAGGQAVTFPQPWNKLSALTTRRFQYVTDCLEGIKSGYYKGAAA